MKIFRLILSWIISSFLIFSGVVTITFSFWFGLFLLIGGVIVLPLMTPMFEKYKIKLNSWLRMLIALILFLFGGIFLYDGSEPSFDRYLTSEEITASVQELDNLNQDLLATAINVIDYCEEIYGKENAKKECEIHYERMYNTEKTVKNLIKLLKSEDKISVSKYDNDIENIKQSISTLERAESALKIKDNQNVDRGNTTNDSNKEHNEDNVNNDTVQINKYEEILEKYSARLRRECPTLSVMECAEISNEGVLKMAEYMYSAKGINGQYGTYEKWAGKLIDVYTQEAR